MKTAILSILLLLIAFLSQAQSLKDFKKKTETNAKERTQMLDLLRTDIKNSLEQDVVFVVDHFKVFEKHGFIWGGRWKHYDTMHFEYRPEFFVP